MCAWVHVCLCLQSKGRIMWFGSPKWNSSYVPVCSEELSGVAGDERVHKASIHCHCYCRKNRDSSHGFPCYLPHCHVALSFLFHSLPSPSSSLSLCPPLCPPWPPPPQERISNTTTGYHWYGARNRDDQALWTCQQICQQHQQATGRSGGERGEVEHEEMLQLSLKVWNFIPV